MSGALRVERQLPGPAAFLGLGALMLLVVLAYWPTVLWLAQRYQAPDSLYGHGPLVPLASLYLVWRQRARLGALVDQGSLWALGALVPVLCLHLAAVALRVDSLSGLSLLLLCPTLVWLLGGRALVMALWFPLAFLVFAWPPPMFVLAEMSQLLKEWVILAAVACLDLCRAGVVAQGSYLLLPEGGRLLIDDTCSGMRSLVALVALGTFMAGTAESLTTARRWVLLCLAVPVALAANLLRVLFLTLLGLWGGVPLAARAHDPSGYAVYLVAIAAYVLLERRLRTRAKGAGP